MPSKFKIKIGTKLAISAVVSGLLVGGIVANQWRSNDRILSAIDAVGREQTVFNGIAAAQLAMSRMQSEFKSIALAKTPAELAKAIATIKSLEQAGEHSLETPIAVALKPDALKEMQGILFQFAESCEQYAEIGRSDLRGGVVDAAEAEAARTTLLATAIDIEKAIAAALDSAHSNSDAATASVRNGTETAGTIGLGAGGLALLVLLGSTIFMMLNVARPVRRIGDVLLQLTEGRTDIAIPYARRGDEVGETARAAQIFKDNLERMHALEAEAELARAGTEAQRRAAMHRIADGFEQAVGGVIAMVTAAATELQATAEAMTTTAGETAGPSNAVATGAREAAANVGTVAAAAEQLGASVQEIARQVDGSAELARIAVAEAGQTAALVQELNVAASRIGDVVRMISEIAGQTNLLALNATIEAARAGEAGRGFAVVAAEVKQLASQTAKATDEIGSQIARIQGATTQSVAAIDGITQRIREISDVATSIAVSVEQQGAATQDIVRNVTLAAAGTGDVTANVAGVADAAKQTGVSAGQVLSAASELSRQSEHLDGEVQRFLETIRAA